MRISNFGQGGEVGSDLDSSVPDGGTGGGRSAMAVGDVADGVGRVQERGFQPRTLAARSDGQFSGCRRRAIERSYRSPECGARLPGSGIGPGVGIGDCPVITRSALASCCRVGVALSCGERDAMNIDLCILSHGRMPWRAF